ncbi:GNAT family N-acetyltransferase [Candidatus Amarolinea dominans]|uniref:GNAT family N-acetyltransferase n=1 Tax=Candidatus Amarolinea dominans TaxID=3140696 RepID=UPI0031CC58E7
MSPRQRTVRHSHAGATRTRRRAGADPPHGGEGPADPTNLHWQNFLLAEVDGQVVGCGRIRPHPGLRNCSMVVRSAYRKRGVGAALMRALLAQGTPPLFLECPPYRVSFYERFGFRLAGFGEIPWVLRLEMAPGQHPGAG